MGKKLNLPVFMSFEVSAVALVAFIALSIWMMRLHKRPREVYEIRMLPYQTLAFFAGAGAFISAVQFFTHVLAMMHR